MNRIQVASDIRDMIRECLGESCDYKIVIARGRPTEECNMIALWFGDEEVDRYGDCADGFCDIELETRLSVRLTRICYAPTGNINADFEAEEAEAVCFYRDVAVLECCLDTSSAALVQIKRDHGIDSIARVRTRMPGESSQGGATSATLELVVTYSQCCDELLS